MKQALIILSAVCLVTVVAHAEERYITAPGTEVIIGKIKPGTKLDELGCAYEQPSLYRCYAGQLAGMHFTSREEAVAAGRFIFNPNTMYSPNQIRENIKSGRGYQVK